MKSQAFKLVTIAMIATGLALQGPWQQMYACLMFGHSLKPSPRNLSRCSRRCGGLAQSG